MIYIGNVGGEIVSFFHQPRAILEQFNYFNTHTFFLPIFPTLARYHQDILLPKIDAIQIILDEYYFVTD